MSGRFALLVPVKTLMRAKSRLGVPDPRTRQALVRAFAYDAVDAALASPAVTEVFVVSDEPDLAVRGCAFLPDEGDGDLNQALRAAAARVAAMSPGSGIAAMCADVPCLLEADLTAALEAVSTRAFVADAMGTGTTLLASTGGDLDPHFGLDSARRHRDSGAVALDLAVASLRQDVDTTDDLARAVALGVGPHTRAVIERADLAPGRVDGDDPEGSPPS